MSGPPWQLWTVGSQESQTFPYIFFFSLLVTMAAAAAPHRYMPHYADAETDAVFLFPLTTPKVWNFLPRRRSEKCFPVSFIVW